MENELFEKAPVHKAYFAMALPVAMGMVISLVYNMVDTFFIAQTGNTNLVAGVSLGAPVFTLMVALGDIWGLGGSSAISRLFGKKQDADGKRLSVFTFYAAILCGIAVAAVMLLARGPILGLLGADQDTREYASQYYTWIAAGAPFIILSLVPNNQLRTEGFAKEAMIGSVIGTVVNIILDPIFISVIGWGAAGAAIATVIGYLSTDAYFVWILVKKSRKLSVNPKGMSVSGPEIGQILAIGIPASITNLMQSLAIAMTNRYLLAYGNEQVAAMGIVLKVNMITSMVLIGFAFGGQPLFGYSYGAGNKKRLKEIMAFCYKFLVGLAAVLAIVLALAARPLIGIFMSDAGIIRIGVPMLRLLQLGMPFMAVVLVTTCIFQSTGKAVSAFLLSVSRQGVIYAAVIFLASRATGYNGIIASQAISDVLTAVLAVSLLYRGLYKELRD